MSLVLWNQNSFTQTRRKLWFLVLILDYLILEIWIQIIRRTHPMILSVSSRTPTSWTASCCQTGHTPSPVKPKQRTNDECSSLVSSSGGGAFLLDTNNIFSSRLNGEKNTFLRTCLAPPLPVSVPVHLRTRDRQRWPRPPASLNLTSGEMVADVETFGLLDGNTQLFLFA